MSAFTALNGGSPKATESPAEKCIKVDTSDEGDKSHNQGSPKTSTLRKDGWSIQNIHRPPVSSGRFANADASQKRKRSNSIELGREVASTKAQTPEATSIESQNESREMHETPHQESSKQYGEDWQDKDSFWPTQHHSRAERNGHDSQQTSATSPRGQTEDQIGETLRRAAGQMDHSDYTNTSPDAEDRSAAAHGSPYGSEQRQDSLLHHDPKKRKRNFSNRTKTGCLTCRKRKKKCDESKPECELLILSFQSSASTLVLSAHQGFQA